MKLGDFLVAAAADRGPWNCSTMAADWCVALGYPDFAAEWRGIVDIAECEAVAADAGGLVNLWERGIGGGLPAASEPYQAGDIAVVAAHGLEAGAIFTGERWVFRLPRGIASLPVERAAIVKAWRP